jgi:hypothetical protein
MAALKGILTPLLSKLIRGGVGRWRFLMATTGMGVAVFFILLAVQMFLNFNELLHGRRNENETADFLVVNKSVRDGKKAEAAFSGEEIDSLSRMPFVERLGRLTSSGYNVSVSSYTDAFPFYTDAYFEAVPDEFIDVKSAGWAWKEGDRVLPIIIPTFFIDLYNTGMAMTQPDLPQLSMDALRVIPLRVQLRGNGRTAEFTGQVLATSDRINAILVPQAFMDWGNQTLGYRASPPSTRIVIKTKDPSDPKLSKYLADRGWRTNTDKTRFSKVRVIVNWIVSIVGAIGGVMFLFGLLVFSLFIQLTIASSRPDIALLKTLGLSARRLEKFLLGQFLPVHFVLLGAVLAALSLFQWMLFGLLQTKDMHVRPVLHWITWLSALVVLGLTVFTNRHTIRRYLRQ